MKWLFFVGVFLSALNFNAGSSAANDSVAELGTGGLILARTGEIRIARERLFISLEKVAVDYEFSNQSDKLIETVVAFPMPDITATPYEAVVTPINASDNFLGFTVTIDGKTLKPNLQQRAWAGRLDVTDILLEAGVPLFPYAGNMGEVLKSLPQERIDDFLGRGIVMIDSYDAGQGLQTDIAPIWTVKSAYWWNMRFPAGQITRVSHSYTPSVGGTAGLSFVDQEGGPGYSYRAYQEKYCIDEGFFPAASRIVRQSKDEIVPYGEHRIAYILSSGANWGGPIGEFELVVDKGTTSNLISFCAQNVTKTGPTRFTMKAKDFVPERELDILFMVRLSP